MNLIDALVALILLVGLLENGLPIIPIVAIGMVILRAASLRVTKGLGFKKVEWALVLCLGYWLVNYFLSSRSPGNLMSYDFLRHDGAMLVSYTALLFLLGWPLKASQCRAFWIIFLITLSLIALAGTAQRLNLPYSWLLEPLGVVGDEPGVGGDMFFGWYYAHNTAGGVYAVASVLALALLQEAKLTPKQKIFRSGLLACCLSGLALTYSRGAYLGFVAGAAVVLPLRKFGQTLKIILLLVVPAGAIIVMSSSVIARIDTITDPYWGTNADRITMWAEALRDFSNSPVIGMGFGRYNDADLQFWGIKGVVWVATHGKIINDDSHAHNSYLHFLAEGGLVGLFVTMWVWWCAWKELSFFQSHFPRSKLYTLERAAKGGLMVAMGQAMTEHLLGRGSVLLVLGTLVGTTLATARMEARSAKTTALEPVADPSRAKPPEARVRGEPLPVR